ncbi:hypothetical protein AB0K60_34775 [Thermopolyspora sp. NPDC052614]|uniref:hypothetical protein n=1 Tax=Thermopolyspora sp. NPDC052614 TaxID=3155682 RepID=UPI003442D816
MVNALDLKALRAVLATTKSKTPGGRVAGARTVLYTGAISLRQLGKVSEQARAMAELLKDEKPLKVSWKLWVAKDQLPRRFTTSLVLASDPKVGKAVISSDTRFSGWGTRAQVKAPPAAQVIDIEDLASGEELAEQFSGQALIPFGDPYAGLKLEQ